VTAQVLENSGGSEKAGLPRLALEFWAQTDTIRALVHVDGEGAIDFWNSAAEQLTGLTPQEVLGRAWGSLFQIPLTLVDTPVTFRHKEGVALTLRFRCQWLGTDQGWAVTFESLHQAACLELLQQATEEALRQSEERFQIALQGANDGIWDWNLATNSVFFSSRWKSMLGYSDAELADHIDTWQRLVHPEDLPGAVERVGQYLSGALDRYEIEFRMAHKDGGYRDILARGHKVLDSQGQPARLVGTHVDLTERKRTEEALRLSEQMLQRTQAIANVAGWTYLIEPERLVTTPDGEQLLDRGRAPAFENIHPEDLPGMEAAWQAALLGEELEIEYRLLHGAEVTWVFARATTELDGDGSPLRVTGVVQDITARRRLEEQFQRSQKMEAIGQLAGGLAHDYNNLTTIINGSAELLLSDWPEECCKEDLLAILEAGDRAATLTRQLLAFGRKQLLRPQPLDLNQVVQNFRRMVDRVIREDIALMTSSQPEVWTVQADLGQVEQVLLNLVINARDAMPTGGVLTLTTRNHTLPAGANLDCAAGEYVELSVTDTGIGMSEEVKEKIFQPFFTTKEIGQGSGLGLSTVYGIVHQSGGRVQVASQPGKGSTFSVFFPAVAGARSVPQSPSLDTARGEARGTILLVEDEAGVRRVTKRFLERQGYAVLDACCAEEALERVAGCGCAVHLLLTDVIMPGRLSGPELAARLQAQIQGLKVLYMSGYAGDSLSQNGILEGDQFLPKPFTARTLLDKVNLALAG